MKKKKPPCEDEWGIDETFDIFGEDSGMIQRWRELRGVEMAQGVKDASLRLQLLPSVKRMEASHDSNPSDNKKTK